MSVSNFDLMKLQVRRKLQWEDYFNRARNYGGDDDIEYSVLDIPTRKSVAKDITFSEPHLHSFSNASSTNNDCDVNKKHRNKLKQKKKRKEFSKRQQKSVAKNVFQTEKLSKTNAFGFKVEDVLIKDLNVYKTEKFRKTNAFGFKIEDVLIKNHENTVKSKVKNVHQTEKFNKIKAFGYNSEDVLVKEHKDTVNKTPVSVVTRNSKQIKICKQDEINTTSNISTPESVLELFEDKCSSKLEDSVNFKSKNFNFVIVNSSEEFQPSKTISVNDMFDMWSENEMDFEQNSEMKHSFYDSNLDAHKIAEISPISVLSTIYNITDHSSSLDSVKHKTHFASRDKIYESSICSSSERGASNGSLTIEHVERLQVTMDEIQSDESIFSDLIDESKSFLKIINLSDSISNDSFNNTDTRSSDHNVTNTTDTQFHTQTKRKNAQCKENNPKGLFDMKQINVSTPKTNKCRKISFEVNA